MLPCINTASCWVVKAPFVVKMMNGNKKIVENGFAIQTPKLFDRKKIKIVSDGSVSILEGREVREIVDGNGNVFW